MDEQKNIEIEQENLAVPTGEVEHAQPPERAEIQENVITPQEVPSKVQVPPPIPDNQKFQPAPVQAPVMPPQNNPVPQTTIPSNNDLDAEEGNIIEKPWVDAAENIIKRDEGNPYLEEEDHEDLQLKYLKKRFGKEIQRGEEEEGR